MSEPDLNELFDPIDKARAEIFDPVRFAYIASLAYRTCISSNLDNTALLNKLNTALDSFRSDFLSAEKEAKNNLQALQSKSSESASEHYDAAKGLLDSGNFRQLEKLIDSLSNEHTKQNTKLGLNLNHTASSLPVSLLTELNALVKSKVDNAGDDNTERSFDDILNQQVNDLSASSETLQEQSHALNNDAPEELQSMKAFRESMKYFNIDKVIERAINDLPANPGPHNPHMLAIKSLTQMRELSPQYLRRFAAYIETLLWLEKNANKLSKPKNTP